jgi:hypothetical protein
MIWRIAMDLDAWEEYMDTVDDLAGRMNRAEATLRSLNELVDRLMVSTEALKADQAKLAQEMRCTRALMRRRIRIARKSR